MIRVAAAGLAGWATIMALGWWLAGARANQCAETYNCKVHELATRDAFLIVGLIVPFLVMAVFVIWMARREHLLGHRVEPMPGARQVPLVPTRLLNPAWRELRPAFRLPSAALAVAAFAVGWASAYLALVWLPARTSSPSDEAVDAAAEAAIEAASPYAVIETGEPYAGIDVEQSPQPAPPLDEGSEEQLQTGWDAANGD